MGAQDNHISLDGPMRRILATDVASGEPCPSPEIFAAYYEHSLDPEETERYDRHLASCSACRAILAGVARASVDTSVPAHESRAPRRRWNDLRVWLIPAAAGLAAVLIVVALYRHSATGPQHGAELAMQRAEPAPIVSAPPSTEAAPQPASPPTVLPESRQSDVATDSLKKVQPQPAPPDSNSAFALSGHANSRAAGASSADRKSASSAAPPPAPPPVSAASSETAANVTSEAQLTPSAPGQAKQFDKLETQNRAPQQLGPPANALMARRNSGALLNDHLVVTSPGSSITWTIHTNHVQYAENGQPAPVQDFLPTNSAIAAGSSPGGNVCWLVGAAGAVVRTTDGRNWLAANSPANVDLTGITATTAKAATVTASGGKIYVTSDGGQTWKAQN
jgi:Putative zinc-finger